MAAQLRGQQALLPLLLFPLVTPVRLAAGKATALVVLGDPMDQSSAWLLLLAVFNGLFWPLCMALFGEVIEE
jgi:heme exporter protein B